MKTIPSRDAVLRRVVARVAADDALQTPDELAERLRPLYPQVAVFERQLSGERPQYYVYRDGRYEPDRPDRWWEQTDVPCVRVDGATGRLVSMTGAWAELMHADAASLVGRHFAEFVRPEARAVAEAMFEALAEEREVRSEAVVARPDGTTVAIEFRAVRRDGEIEVCYRPLKP